ncbi:MAG: pyridoxal-dependent decarboxylase, partial [Acidimicrobiales bacterium]
TFALNFSRPGAQVAGQYFNFLRLGEEGFRDVQQACRDTAKWLSAQIAALEEYELISDERGLPVFAFRTTSEAKFTVYDVSDMLRGKGWLVPAYPMPPGMEEISVLRIVVRNGFSHDLATLLFRDLAAVTQRLAASHVLSVPAAAGPPAQERTGFHH